MFPDLVVMDRIDDDMSQPLGLTTPGHGLPREFSERIPILLGRSCGHSQCPFGFGVVGREENAAVCLHREHAVTGLEPQAIGHVLRQRGTYRATGLAQRHFLGHAGMVAYLCYAPARQVGWYVVRAVDLK